MKRALKRIGCAAFAAGLLVGGAFCFTSCTTDRPKVEMQLSFNGETYTLHYTLYRKIAPNTVNHFLALAENKYYDGLCVHDYETDGKLYTGAYSYDADATATGGLVYKQYYQVVKQYKDFPIGVWTNSANDVPTYTLQGEFEANNFSVKNGDFLSQDFGALTMYYTDKGEDENTVSVKRVSDKGYSNKEYRYNCATSMFTISLNNGGTNNNYCTFATLDDGSHATLQNLKTALAECEAEYDEGGSFTIEKEISVDEDDYFVGESDNKATYNIPETPIIINYVKVNKY